MRQKSNAALIAFLVMYLAGAQAAGQAANVISVHGKAQTKSQDKRRPSKFNGVTIPREIVAQGFSSHYQIQATLDPVRNVMHASERVIFVNHTSRTLDYIPIVHGGAAPGSHFTAGDRKGRQLRIELGSEGAPARVLLGSPVTPRGRVDLRISFDARVVPKDGYFAATDDWHPKVVATITGAFDAEQKQPDSYDVTVTIPANQIVVASGRDIAPNATRTFRFIADNICNFGLVFSPRLKMTIRNSGGVEIRSYYFPGGEKWGQKLPEYAADVIDFYTKTYGYYPQKTLSIVPGSKNSVGGYPLASNIIAIHDTLDSPQRGEPFARWITAHEIGHEYWGWDCVIDSGHYVHWPTLGLSLYGDHLYNEARNPAGLDIHRSFLNSYLSAVANGYDTTIRNADTDKLPFDALSVTGHGKGFSVVQMLSDVLGRERMLKLLRIVLTRYRNRYLSFEAFQAAAEEVAGQELDWFFREWVNENKILRYVIENVEQVNGEVRVQVRRTGTAVMPMDLEIQMENGERQRKRIDGEPERQIVIFNAAGRVRQARLDPDGRMALYSPLDEHVWGKMIDVLDMRIAEPLAWGSNRVSVTVRNKDNRAHDVVVDCQARSVSPSRGFGAQVKVTVAPAEQRMIEHECTFPPFPGKARARVRVDDATDKLHLALRDITADFSFANDRTNPVRLNAATQAALNSPKSEYARLVKSEAGHFVFYCFEDDSFALAHLKDEARKREQVYQQLVAQLNPSFKDRITIYFFPDQLSKRILTGHQGMGWATGRLLVEVFNEKERVDPFHELTHIIAGTIGEPPALFNEGFAVYMQEGQKWDGYNIDAWSKAFVREKMPWPMPTLFDFEEIGSDGTKPAIAYPQAASFVKFLIDAYGFDKFKAAYRELKKTDQDSIRQQNNQTFVNIFGITIEEAETHWLEKLNNTATEPIPEAKLNEIKKQN